MEKESISIVETPAKGLIISEDFLENQFVKSNRRHFTYFYVGYITNYLNWRYLESLFQLGSATEAAATETQVHIQAHCPNTLE